MAFFDLPLNLPHAATISERILRYLEGYEDAQGRPYRHAMQPALELLELLFIYKLADDNPPEPEASEVRDRAAQLGRDIVEGIEMYGLESDGLGKAIRNLFECLELGEEGAEISLRAGENPNSLQRPR